MKKIAFTSSVALLTFASPLYAEGDGEYYENPGLSAYMAEKAELPPPPKIEFPFPEGLYVGVTGGAGKINSVDIKNRPAVNGPIVEFSQINNRKTLAQVGGSIGYIFREAGFFNQLEIQYLNRSNFSYKGILNGSGLMPILFDTSIKSQTGMAKLYSTLNIGYNLFPYVFLGAGVVNNKAPATLTLPNGVTIPLNTATNFNAALLGPDLASLTSTVINSPFGQTSIVTTQLVDNTANNPSTKQRSSRTSAAGSAGAGVRFRVSNQVMLDVNYEYTYLGKLRDWHILSTTAAQPPIVTFRGSKLSGHALNFSVLFQPWGYASEAD